MNIGDEIENNIQKILLAGILITIGVLGRIVLHDFFNGIINPWEESGMLGLDVFFVIAVVSIASGILLGKYYTLIVPICVLIITDAFYALVEPVNVLLYTSWLFLFTVSGYIVIALLGFYVKKKSKLTMTFVPKILGAGILGIVMYDLWTNFGFWLSFSRMYPTYLAPTFEGLVTAYTWGIPVMIWHVLSGAIAITVITIPIIYFKEHKLFSSEIILKPFEKYTIASATLALIILSIISAII
jgi:hypothetical protein